MTIAGILKHKGFNVTTVTPGMTIAEVAQVLASKRIGAVLVLDAAGQLLGILSERDIVACLAEHGPRTLEMTAARLMTAEVQTESQRTTVDVLNSQQDLISAKARLIGAQRDRVIASYTLLSAIGRLDVKTLALNTPDYLPEVHYHQVRDAWHGLRTPSGQ